MIFSKTIYAQKGLSCDSAKVLSYPINNTVTNYTASAYWFKVTLNAGNYVVKVTNLPSVGKITKADVYTGSCTSLINIKTDTLFNSSDTILNIRINSETTTTYFVKLYNSGGAVSFNKSMATDVYIVGQLGFCPGQQVTLSSFPVNATGTKTYTWQPGGANTSSITVSPTNTITATTYTLTYNDGGGTLTTTINIFPLSSNECKKCEQVQNGHFEWYNALSTGINNISNTYFWSNPTGASPDYLNVNFLDPNIDIPNNAYATGTPAYSGNGYAGFTTFFAPVANFREYVQNTLTCPLVVGQGYRINFYTINANHSARSTNNIGAYLSATPLASLTTTALTSLAPQLNYTTAITYSTSWTQITGTVTGNNQQYMTIGNFSNDANTSIVNSTSPNGITFGGVYAYYFIDNISITPLTPTLSASTTTINCNSPSSITLTATGSSSVYTSWTNGINTYSGSVVTIPSPTVTTTYTCNVNLPCSTCSTITQTITITVNPTPSLTVSSSSSLSCAGQNTTLTASGATTYSWNPGALSGSTVVVSPTVATVYTVTGYNGPCSVTSTLAVNVNTSCACYSITPLGTTGTISASPASNQKYSITNNATIVGNVTFASAEFQLAANITLTVAANSTLTINRSHLYAGSTSMWTGIVVLNGGRLDIINNSLIEDAIKAVSITNNTSTNQVLTVDASIFNKNQTDIAISTYTQNIATYPFTITNSLFTSRLIAPCNSMANWPLTSAVKAATNPTVSPLETPYINNTTYPVTTLLAPYAGKKPYYAITLSNVGFSNVTTTSSSYQEFVIGTSVGTNSYNVFDNHYIAISATNANINVTNSIFQNGFNLAFPSLYSTGIKNLSSGANYRLQASSTSYTNNCKFYDLTRAVYTQNLHDLNINYCEMYSTHVFTPGTASQYGAYGVSATSCHYRNVELNNNKIFNIDNGLVFNAGVGSYTVGTTTGNGQYLGSINANNNIIRSHVTGYTPNPSLHYGFKAITLSSILGQANVTQAGQVVNTNNNTIYDYENGIFCSNWPLHFTVSESNNVTIRNAATSVQYGIEHDNNSDGTPWPASFYSQGIRLNFVTATSISTNPSNYAIRSSQNTASAVRCNTVSNTYNGIAYSGTAVQKSFFQFNDFNGNNKYGFVLENAGVIGQQGAPDVGPTDNRWLGNSWVSPNFKTATLGTSSAVSSIVYIRLAPTDFNPNASSYTNLAYGVDDYYYSGTTGTLRQGNNASYWGCSWAKPAGTVNNTMITASSRVGTTLQDITLMEEIVLSQPTTNEQAQALAVAKEQVFVQLKETPEAMLNSAILTNFYNNTLNSNTAVLANIAQDIAQGDKNMAQATITAITPQNTNETKHKQFLALLLKYSNQPLNASDEQQLLSLANGCPSLEGTYVHEARTLYNVAFDKNNSFMDNCVAAANNARMAKTDDTKTTEEQFANSILLYPNPSHTGDVAILTNADTEALEIEINTVNGLTVLKQNVTLHNHAAKLNLNVNDGVYIVIITNTKTKQRVTKKLVIQQ